MLYDFKLPHDLYYWGQDRYGSLIPLLGQLFFKIFNFQAITSESLTHYILLTLGYFGFASLLKSKVNKIIFAFIWFFPPMRMIDLLRLNLGTQYCLIGMSVFIINKLSLYKYENNNIRKHLLLLLVVVLLSTSIWVADTSVITVFILLTLLACNYYKKYSIKSIFTSNEIYYALFGCLITTVFIIYAKSVSTKVSHYQEFNSIPIIIDSFKIFVETLYSFISFNSDEPFTSIYCYLLLGLLSLIAFFYKHIQINSTIKKWVILFVLDGMAVIGVIMISKWAYLNGVPRRYFVSAYISFWIAGLILVDNWHVEKGGKYILNTILFFTVFVGSIGAIYNMQYVSPKRLTPMVKIVRELDTLGRIGIIGEYWNSYIYACANPDSIKATPNDVPWGVRNIDLAHEVVRERNIYIIKDSWLEHYPDTLRQFGAMLLKDGDEFNLANCTLCKYKRVGSY